jgi:hypothetical protein
VPLVPTSASDADPVDADEQKAEPPPILPVTCRSSALSVRLAGRGCRRLR